MPVERTPTLTKAPVAGKNTDSVATKVMDWHCAKVANVLREYVDEITMMMSKMSVELRKIS